jgi:hypothetical protein
MTIKSIATSAAPVVVGVVAAGMLLYAFGGSISFLGNAQKGLAGQNSTTAATTTTGTSILTTLSNLL